MLNKSTDNQWNNPSQHVIAIAKLLVDSLADASVLLNTNLEIIHYNAAYLKIRLTDITLYR